MEEKNIVLSSPAGAKKTGLDVFGADYSTAVEMATAISQSRLVPEIYQGPNNVPNVLIALEMSQRIGLGVVEVCQNLEIIKGKPAWKSEYVVANHQASRMWKSWDYEEEIDGEAQIPDLTWGPTVVEKARKVPNKRCRIVAVRASDGKTVYGSWVSVQMAIDDGWWYKGSKGSTPPGKNSSKWPHLTDQMLRYRAATFFNRAYPASTLHGIRPADEVEDIDYVDGEQVVSGRPSSLVDKLKARQAPVAPAEISPEPEPEEVSVVTDAAGNVITGADGKPIVNPFG